MGQVGLFIAFVCPNLSFRCEFCWVDFTQCKTSEVSLLNMKGQIFASKTIPDKICNIFSLKEHYLHLKLYVWSMKLYMLTQCTFSGGSKHSDSEVYHISLNIQNMTSTLGAFQHVISSQLKEQIFDCESPKASHACLESVKLKTSV